MFLMKKLLIILLLSIVSFTDVTAQVAQQDWTIENKGQWGSFYWSVSRSTYADDYGKYWYYVYASSNSLLNRKSDGYNYDKAITYVRNVNIYMYEYKYSGGGGHYNTATVKLTHFTCDYYVDPNHYIGYFWSYSPYNTFRLTFDKATAYDKSYY